jgi:uncharacterized protein involved in outer membrane biogenesis
MKKLWIALVAFAVLAAVAIAAGAFAARAARDVIERQRHDILGLAIDIKGYGVNWQDASLALEGIRIYPKGHEDDAHVLASAEKLYVEISPWDAFRKVLHAKEVLLVKPSIALVKTAPGRYNWDALKLAEGDEDQGEDTEIAEKAWRVVVDSVTIEDGDVAYRDTVKGHRIELKGLELEISDLADEDDPEKLPTDFAMSAKIGDTGGAVKVDGKLNAFAKGINFALKAHMSSTPITYFHSFYAGSAPFPIVGGSISMSSDARSKLSQLTSGHHATIVGLKAGGGLKGDLINRYILSKGGPIGVDATVNGDLEKGDLHIGTAISEHISEALLADAMKMSPLNLPTEALKAVPGIKKPGTSVGDKVKGLFRR